MQGGYMNVLATQQFQRRKAAAWENQEAKSGKPGIFCGQETSAGITTRHRQGLLSAPNFPLHIDPIFPNAVVRDHVE